MKKILVIGDSCQDVFIYGKTERLSPEGPAPVFIPLYETKNDGMAKNVVNNLKSFGLEVDLITNKTVMKKVRYIDDSFNHLFLRVDENDSCERIDLNDIGDIIEYSAIVIPDYDKGFLTTDDMEYISSLHPLVITDTKKKLGEWSNSFKFIKLNNLEYQNNKDYIQQNKSLLNKIIVTSGKDGSYYMGTRYLTQTVDAQDVSGAGDTFTSAFIYKYLETNNISESIKFSNKCATEVVTQRGVTVWKK
jgi:bifunctional ADP-heptose synthase (sugar kinase/adenylyltransferase)